MSESDFKALQERMAAAENRLTSIEKWKAETVDWSKTTVDRVNRIALKVDEIADVAEKYKAGKIQAAGLGQIATEIKEVANNINALLAHGLAPVTNNTAAPAPAPQSPPPAQNNEHPAPLAQIAAYKAAIASLPDSDKVEFNIGVDGKVSGRSTKYLGDSWKAISDKLKEYGFKWEKGVGWIQGSAPASTPPAQNSSGSGKPQMRDPDSPATEKQIALMQKMKISVPYNCTKAQASALIDAKMRK